LAAITMAPHLDFFEEGKVKITLDVTKRVLEQHDPGGLALLNWSFTLMDIDDPASRVTEVKAVFDTGAVTTQGTTLEVKIPRGAGRLTALEVGWAWAGNERKLVFRRGPQFK
jgi:hypothetical protein